ncbi:MAG: ribbon-helix-helix protein, CopG family [Bacteroidetes bacterium]|jgi:predicted DNA binding CopG/RHH family protein|nr:ribbon-helix-helix protein, CopG family [Bacteroidota bacterium]
MMLKPVHDSTSEGTKEVRLNFRIEKDLFERLKARADKHGISYSSLLRKLIEQELKKTK